MTWYLHGGQNGYIINSLLMEVPTNNANSTLSCENLCNITQPLDCSKPALTLSNVKYWMYVNWAIFAICFIRLLKGIGFSFYYILIQLKKLNFKMTTEF